MRTNWSVVAAILAVLAVPFSIAAIQDLGRETPVLGPDQAEAVDRELREPALRHPDRKREGGAAEEQRPQRTELGGRSFVDRLLLAGGADRPGLRGALAGARFGMTRDQLRAEAGALWRWAEQGISEYRPASVRLEFEGDGGQGLSTVAVRFPDDGSARRVLAEAWGDPVAAEGQDKEMRHFWFDDASGMRVLLHRVSSPSVADESEIVYQHVQPIASFYRRGRGFAFERRPILGATPAELSAIFGGDFEFEASSPGAGRLFLDPTDYARARTQCTIAFQGGRAIALQIVIDHGWKASFGPLAFDAIRTQLGPVRVAAKDENGHHWTFDDGITVQQLADSPQLVVSASRP